MSVVRREGLEPTCLAAPAPKAGASTNSATLAAVACTKKRDKNNVLYPRVSVGHYENFPVASLLLPAPLRAPIEVIYRFARSADDIADEGNDAPDMRLAKLSVYQARLAKIASGETPDDPLFRDVAGIVRSHRLPIQLFRDLLDAFAQDVTKKRYLPQDEMARHGVTEGHLAGRRCDQAWRALMEFQVIRSRNLLLSGKSLGRSLPGRVGLEIRATIQGGLRILEKIQTARYDVFNRRPVLGAFDWPLLLLRAV